jgi:hypothetical protein
MIGVTLPVFSAPEITADKLYWFRWSAVEFEDAVKSCQELYGVCSSEDDETLNLYQPQWRTACAFAPFGAEHAHDKPNDALGVWMATLAARKNEHEKNAALDAYAASLTERFPHDVVLRSTDESIIIRDAAAPQIGMAVSTKDSPEDVQSGWRQMKNSAIAFTERLKKFTETYDFNIRAGRRTLYLEHAIYERLSGQIRLFSKTGDDEIAFGILDNLQAQVLERDQYQQITQDNLDRLKTDAVSMSTVEKDGIITHEYTMQRTFSNTATVLPLRMTRNQRLSLIEDARFHEALGEIHLDNVRGSLHELGYSTHVAKDGTLQIEHKLYDISLSLPGFDKLHTVKNTSAFAVLFTKGNAGATFWEDYYKAKLTLHNAQNLFELACEKFLAGGQSIMPVYKVIADEVVQKYKYQAEGICEKGVWHILFSKPPHVFTNGPSFCRIPAIRLPPSIGAGVFYIGQKGLDRIRELRDTLAAGNKAIAQNTSWPQNIPLAPSTPRNLFLDSVLSRSASPKQNIKGAAASITLPGLGGFKYNNV